MGIFNKKNGPPLYIHVNPRAKLTAHGGTRHAALVSCMAVLPGASQSRRLMRGRCLTTSLARSPPLRHHSTPSGQGQRSHLEDIMIILFQPNNRACRSRCSETRPTNQSIKGPCRATQARSNHAGEFPSGQAHVVRPPPIPVTYN